MSLTLSLPPFATIFSDLPATLNEITVALDTLLYLTVISELFAAVLGSSPTKAATVAAANLLVFCISLICL